MPIYRHKNERGGLKVRVWESKGEGERLSSRLDSSLGFFFFNLYQIFV